MLNTLYANDVRQMLDHFRRSVDQVFESFYGYPTHTTAPVMSGEKTWSFSPVLESAWTENFLNYRAILPGISEKDVKVTIQNNQLTIEGERKVPEGTEKAAWPQTAYGKFYTAVTLPAGLDLDNINCRLQHGVLDIQVPVTTTNKPKQIPIRAVGETTKKAIGA
jgi:HSP20 family protein